MSDGRANPELVERGPAPPPLSLSALTEPVPRALLRLAVPILASHLLRLAYQWVDAFWVRGLGVEATAAVTNSVFFLWSFQALNDMVRVGTVAFVSQLLGAGQVRRLRWSAERRAGESAKAAAAEVVARARLRAVCRAPA